MTFNLERTMKMNLLPLLLLSLLACGDKDGDSGVAEESDADADADTDADADADTDADTDADVPEEGCEVTAWLDYSGQEFDYFFQIYDDLEQLTYQETVTDWDNVIDEREWYTYLEDGLVETYAWDSDGNSSVDEHYTYGYDKLGQRTEQWLDEGKTGTVDQYWLTDWDQAEHVLGRQHDEDGDELFDNTWTARWNELYTELSCEYDEGDYGELDGISYYTYSADGLVTSVMVDLEPYDGVVEAIYEYVYDGEQVVEYYADSDGDTLWDLSQQITWQDDGRWETYVVSYYTDGSVTDEYTYTATYDTDGHLIQSDVSGDGDSGPVSYTFYYDWSCAE